MAGAETSCGVFSHENYAGVQRLLHLPLPRILRLSKRSDDKRGDQDIFHEIEFIKSVLQGLCVGYLLSLRSK